VRFEQPIPYGDYLLVERVGVGGTAEVFRALRRGRKPGEPPVAVKRLLPHIAEDAFVVRLLQREVGALERIDHPNVVGLHAYGTERGLPYLVMDLVDGASLRELLVPSSGKPRNLLPMPIALWIASRVAAGLGSAWHHGVVHRDISPSNIQLMLDGRVKIVDFGLARVRGMVQTTHGQGLKGKWAYLAPEQIEGQPLDGRCDLFALGSILYEMLIGTPPFRGENREETLRKVREHDIIAIEDATPADGCNQLPPAAWMPDIEAEEVHRLIHALLSHARHGRPGNGQAVALRCNDVLGTIDDIACQAWLTARIEEFAEPVRIEALSAAELRGEEVTDPAGETVTSIGVERNGPESDAARRQQGGSRDAMD